MPSFVILIEVCDGLENLQRDFLREGGEYGRNIHLINWLTVHSTEEAGGLGIYKLLVPNKAF